jgi:hypothetical protein
MKSTKYKYTAIGSAAVLLTLASAHAQDYIWTGAKNATDITDPENWLVGGAIPLTGPVTGNPTQFNGTATTNASLEIGDGNTAVVNAIYVSAQGGGANTNGFLTINSGTLQGSGQNTRYTYGSGGKTGTVNITGTGTIDVGGGTRIGIDSGSVGTLNISGGGSYINARGYTQNSISISVGVGVGNATGTINVTDSGSYTDRFGIMLGDFNSANTGTGTFNITGGAATVAVGQSNNGSDGKWLQSSGSTLGAFVDSADGFSLTTIDIVDYGTPTDGRVSFESGAELNLGFTGSAQAGTWTLMSWGQDFLFEDNGLGLAAGVDPGWSFDFVDTGGTVGADALTVTYVIPEPSIALLGCLGLLGLIRRRRH